MGQQSDELRTLAAELITGTDVNPTEYKRVDDSEAQKKSTEYIKEQSILREIIVEVKNIPETCNSTDEVKIALINALSRGKKEIKNPDLLVKFIDLMDQVVRFQTSDENNNKIFMHIREYWDVLIDPIRISVKDSQKNRQ